ncbi:MAG: ACT domain-containing protein, partial [Bacteroidota bacterium]
LVEGSGMVGVPGTAMRLFSALARHTINVILITQASSEHTICLGIIPHQIDTARAAIEEEFNQEIKEKLIEPVIVERDLSVVAVVGENMRKTSGIAGTLFSALGNSNINVIAIAQGSSERNISVVVARKDEVKALQVMHKAFFGR